MDTPTKNFVRLWKDQLAGNERGGGGSWRTEAFSMACVLATFRDEGAVGDF